jgi:epoxyqueuosine reductase
LLLQPSAKLKKYGLREFLAMGEEEFLSLFADSPIRRIKWRGFMRNVCVAVGNTGTKDDIVLLRRLIGRDEMVDEHAQWAIEEIETRSGGK